MNVSTSLLASKIKIMLEMLLKVEHRQVQIIHNKDVWRAEPFHTDNGLFHTVLERDSSQSNPNSFLSVLSLEIRGKQINQSKNNLKNALRFSLPRTDSDVSFLKS